MNDNPRLGFFDIDPEKFCAMIGEFKKQEAVDMANYNGDEWIDIDGGTMSEDFQDIEEFGYYNDMDNYDDSMDGDFDSAMASAGFGTDEDYGLFDDYDDFYGEE